MPIAFFEVLRAKGATFIASLGHRPRIRVMKKSSSGESAIQLLTPVRFSILVEARFQRLVPWE